MTDRTKGPDPAGLTIAQAIENAVAPATVILYGSRAAGDHRPNSDVDLIIITHDNQASRAAADEATTWVRSAKPALEVNFRTITQEQFREKSRFPQSIPGQAARHGVNTMGENLEYSSQSNPDEEATWQETRGWVERSEEHLKDYNEREDGNHWNLKALGYEAQQAVEHALKGLLAANQDESRFQHDLSSMWNYIDQELPWRNDPESQAGKNAVQELMNHVTVRDSSRGETHNWLTTFATGYRYEIIPKDRDQEERKDLQYLVNRAVTAIQHETLHTRGATREDLFPDGKPWEK